MNRYEQRKQKRLLNPSIAEGYREMAAELQRLQKSTGLDDDFVEHRSVHGSGGDVMGKRGEDDCMGRGGKCH